MISICLPSRDRPESFKRLSQSIFNTVSDPKNIEIVVYRDDDDQSIYEYVGNIKEVRGKRLYPDPSYNECQKVAKGPYYLFVPDDMEFVTKDWDKYILEAFDKYPDKIVFIYVRDNTSSRNFGAVGVLHKNWIDTVGYFFNSDFVRRGDCWINELAKNINRKRCLMNVFVRNHRMITDQTRKEYEAEIIRTNNFRLYQSRKMREKRLQDSILLQNFINNYGT